MCEIAKKTGVNETFPPNGTYMMPIDLYEMIQQVKRGVRMWDSVLDAAWNAAVDRRVGVIADHEARESD